MAEVRKLSRLLHTIKAFEKASLVYAFFTTLLAEPFFRLLGFGVLEKGSEMSLNESSQIFVEQTPHAARKSNLGRMVVRLVQRTQLQPSFYQ